MLFMPNSRVLMDLRSFLGTRPVRLVRVSVQKNPSILALSSRSWLNYTHQHLMHFTPLIFENLDHAWSFSAELCPEGLIGIAGSVLRLVSLFPLLSPMPVVGGPAMMSSRDRSASTHACRKYYKLYQLFLLSNLFYSGYVVLMMSAS